MEGNFGVLVSLAGVAIAFLGQAFGFWKWLSTSLDKVKVDNRVELDKMYALIETRTSELEGIIAGLRALHNAFELDVAKHYASDSRLREMESKFANNMEKLINRFDEFAAKFNQILGRMERTQQDKS